MLGWDRGMMGFRYDGNVLWYRWWRTLTLLNSSRPILTGGPFAATMFFSAVSLKQSTRAYRSLTLVVTLFAFRAALSAHAFSIRGPPLHP